MSGLKDICLQVRYEGTPSTIAPVLHAQTAAVAVTYRIRTSSLARTDLLPASLGLSRILAAGKPVRFLLVVPAQPNPQDPEPDQTVPPELLAQLKPAAEAAAASAPENLRDLAAPFELRIAINTPQQADPSGSTAAPFTPAPFTPAPFTPAPSPSFPIATFCFLLAALA